MLYDDFIFIPLSLCGPSYIVTDSALVRWLLWAGAVCSSWQRQQWVCI